MRQQRTRVRVWQVRRMGVPTATGQQRWDRAYQLLLRWATTSPVAPAVLALPALPEVPRACSDLRPRVDEPPGRPPDH